MGTARREEMESSPAKGKAQGRLLVSTSLDAKDELEEVGIDSFPSHMCRRFLLNAALERNSRGKLIK